MADKTFKNFDDVNPDSLIGGSGRLAKQKVPSALGVIDGLVNPGDASHVGAFRSEVADRRLVLEVGPGKGSFLVALATRHEDALCVGFESRLAFCRRTLARAQKAGQPNVRVVWGDARLTVPLLIETSSVQEAYLLFPDPWWKKKHSNRRHGSHMAGILADALVSGGRLVLKSDVEEYLDGLVSVFLETGRFIQRSLPDGLPLTNREARIIEKMQKVFAAGLSKK